MGLWFLTSSDWPWLTSIFRPARGSCCLLYLFVVLYIHVHFTKIFKKGLDPLNKMLNKNIFINQWPTMFYMLAANCYQILETMRKCPRDQRRSALCCYGDAPHSVSCTVTLPHRQASGDKSLHSHARHANSFPPTNVALVKICALLTVALLYLVFSSGHHCLATNFNCRSNLLNFLHLFLIFLTGAPGSTTAICWKPQTAVAQLYGGKLTQGLKEEEEEGRKLKWKVSVHHLMV